MNETVKRILATLVFLPVLIFILMNNDFNSLYWSVFILLVGVGGTIELAMMFRKKGLTNYPVLVILINVGIYAVYYFALPQNYLIGLILLSVLIGYGLQVFGKDLEKSFVSFLLVLFSVLYLGLMWGTLIPLKVLGVKHLIVLIAGTWFCDIGAYFTGKAIGKHKLDLKTSPNKTVEGFIGGIILSVVAIFVACHFTGIGFRIWMLILPFSTIIGDLLESLYKRYSTVKDSSNLIPGHGGLLDVFDSLIFNAPLYYFSLQLFN
jgi:phosphatidate cytidylyltransferase